PPFYSCKPSFVYLLHLRLLAFPLASHETARKCSRTFPRACPIGKREMLSYSNRLYCAIASLLLAVVCERCYCVYSFDIASVNILSVFCETCYAIFVFDRFNWQIHTFRTQHDSSNF